MENIMATFRFLHTEFWRDDFFMELTPEDKYFYIYLLTNDVCNQCGIYSFSVKIAAVELGYSIDTVKTLLARFVNYDKILYNEKNSEVMIINWYKYNLNLNNKNSRICINTCLKKIKTPEFIRNLYALCSDKFKNEMNLVDELFSGVSFSGPKSGIAIIESHKEEVIDSCPSDSKSITKNEDKEALVYEKPLSSSLEEVNVIQTFQNNFHTPTLLELGKLRQWCSNISPQVVEKAIEVATLANKRNIAYLNGILKNWSNSGIRTLSDYERVCDENEESKSNERKKREIKPPQYRVLPTERYDDEEDF